MLDKSLPFAKLYMKRAADSPLPSYTLPDGFHFSFYSPGDEKDWARIESSVDEFDNEFAALLRFKEDFIRHQQDLKSRLVFIDAPDGSKVATANAWWEFIGDERRAWLHWVSVTPEFQGLGLGKAITSKVTNLYRELEGNCDIWLCTQTWSYKAISIYKKCGYLPTDEKKLYTYKGYKGKRDYKKALKILKTKGIEF